MAALVIDVNCIGVRLALWDEAHALEAHPRSGLDKYHTLLELAIGWFAVTATGNNHLAAVAILANEGDGVLFACATHLANNDVFGIGAILNLETYCTFHAIGHGGGSSSEGWEVGISA